MANGYPVLTPFIPLELSMLCVKSFILEQLKMRILMTLVFILNFGHRFKAAGIIFYKQILHAF